MTTHDPGRRRFLRQAGGILLPLPFLPSLSSFAQSGARPKRFVLVAQDHGVMEHLWYPAGYKTRPYDGRAHHEVSLSSYPGAISEILHEEFNPFREKLTLLRGLDSPVVGINELEHDAIPAFAGSISHESKPGMPRYATIDNVLAESAKIYGAGASPVLRHLSAHLRESEIGFRRSMRIVNGEWEFAANRFFTPWTLFDAFFRVSTPTPASTPAPNHDGLVVDAVKDDVARAARNPRLSKEDSQVLERYLADLFDVERKVKQVQPPRTVALARPTVVDDAQIMTPARYKEHYQAMIDIIALALRNDLIRVVHLGLPCPGNSNPNRYCVFNHLDTNEMRVRLAYHQFSHQDSVRDVNNPEYCVPQMRAIYRFQASLVASLLKALDVPESPASTETVLDNSLVMYANNLSTGSMHLRLDLPVLLAGSLGGRFRTGQFLDYTTPIMHRTDGTLQAREKHVGIDHHRFLVAILQGFGMEEAEYSIPGQPPGFGAAYRHPTISPHLDTSRRRIPLPGLLAG